MTIETLLSMLQFSDGLFPAGAYAHSFGLETYSQDGRVSNAADTGQILRAYLEGGAGPCDAVVVVNALRAATALDSGATPSHHAVVFGMIGGACGWAPEGAAAAFLYSSAVAMVGAATRLIPLGQTQAQRLISEAAPLITSLAREAIRRGVTDMFTFAPAFEIAALRHARLEARLFRS